MLLFHRSNRLIPVVPWILVVTAMAGGVVMTAPIAAHAELLRYDLVVTSVSAGGTIIDGKHVTFSPQAAGLGASTVTMAVYASIEATDSDPTNYGFNMGCLDLMSAQQGSTKLRGNLTATLVATGGPYGRGLAGGDSRGGASTDLNGDGDLDWGSTSLDTKVFVPSVGMAPISGDYIWGTNLVNGRVPIQVGTLTYTVPDSKGRPTGSGATIHAWSFPTTLNTTFLTQTNATTLVGYDFNPETGEADIPIYNWNVTELPGNSPDIADNSSLPDSALDVYVTVTPEPGTVALLAAAAIGLGGWTWRRRKRASSSGRCLRA
jgi:hypothetical protein